MRPVSCATNAVCLWWTNNLAPRPRRSTAATVMMRSSHRDAMVAVKCSVLVRIYLKSPVNRVFGIPNELIQSVAIKAKVLIIRSNYRMSTNSFRLFLE